MGRMSLSTKIILSLIIIIPIIICLYKSFIGYKDLKYDMGESTGYILELKSEKYTTFYGSGLKENEPSSYRVKQTYNIKENDYISESLEKNLEKTDNDDVLSALKEHTINSSNRILLTVKELNEDKVVISVLDSNGYKEISLKYGEKYKVITNKDIGGAHKTETCIIKFEKTK